MADRIKRFGIEGRSTPDKGFVLFHDPSHNVTRVRLFFFDFCDKFYYGTTSSPEMG